MICMSPITTWISSSLRQATQRVYVGCSQIHGGLSSGAPLGVEHLENVENSGIMDKQMMFIYGKGGKTMKNIIELRGKNMGYLWKINENYGNINGNF